MTTYQVRVNERGRLTAIVQVVTYSYSAAVRRALTMYPKYKRSPYWLTVRVA